MVYDSAADFTRRLGHFLVDYTVPRSASIAFISAAVGWHTHNICITYGPDKIAKNVAGLFQWSNPTHDGGFFSRFLSSSSSFVGTWIIAPIVTPTINPGMAKELSMLAAVTTSFTLNVLSIAISHARRPRQDENPPPSAPTETASNVVKDTPPEEPPPHPTPEKIIPSPSQAPPPLSSIAVGKDDDPLDQHRSKWIRC